MQQQARKEWWLISCYLISIVRAVCKIHFFHSRKKKDFPPQKYSLLSPFPVYHGMLPALITITLSTRDFPCATPATLCDDVNHPTIPGPIWQLPTLELFANTGVNETPVLANAPLCSGLKLLGDPHEALKDWLHYGCQHGATHTSWIK